MKNLHYRKFGSGKKFLLCLHGFGQDHSVFLPFEKTLGRTYTILSFDLFFHGQSSWPETELPIEPSQWRKTIADILEKENIKRFSMFGYSFGGKICIATASLMPESVEKLFLAAADGIHYNFWFRFATGNPAGRALFRYLCKKPAPFIKLVKTVARLGLISKNLGRFVAAQLGVKTHRSQLYQTWVGYRKFTMRRSAIIQLLNRHKIELEMISGKYDSVIPYRDLQEFTRQIQLSNFHLIQTGHQSLLRKYNEELMKKKA